MCNRETIGVRIKRQFVQSNKLVRWYILESRSGPFLLSLLLKYRSINYLLMADIFPLEPISIFDALEAV